MTKTWRETLQLANKRVEEAKQARADEVRAAHDAGLTIRQIAAVLNVSASTVHRMLDYNAPLAHVSLDDPAEGGR